MNEHPWDEKGRSRTRLRARVFYFSRNGFPRSVVALRVNNWGRCLMRLFIADRDRLFRSIVRLLVRRDCAVAVCATDDGHNAYAKVRRFNPHLLIVADELITCSGRHLLNRLKGQMGPDTVTVLLSSTQDLSVLPETVDRSDIVIYRHDLFQWLPILINPNAA